MPWVKYEVEHVRKRVKLQPDVSVIGVFEGIFPDAKYEGKWNLNMESLGGESFSINLGVTLREFLIPFQAEFHGKVVLIACVGKLRQFYTYKVGVWEGGITECAEDKINQAVIMRTDKLLGV